MESIHGSKKTLKFDRKTNCRSCKGMGAAEDGRTIKCWTCNGRGKEVFRKGPKIEEMECRNCNGKGREIKKKCGRCLGEGTETQTIEKEIEIPALTKNDFEIVLPEEGNLNPENMIKGSLIVKINVEQSKEFERKGSHIFSEVEITYAQALLGTSFRVNTIWGNKKITIKGISKSEELLTLPNFGILNKKKNVYGNHYVKAKMVPPKELTPEMKNLYESLKIEGL